MAEYKQPKTIPTVDVYNQPNKEYLREANVSDGNVRSNDYKGTKTDGIKTPSKQSTYKSIKQSIHLNYLNLNQPPHKINQPPQLRTPTLS